MARIRSGAGNANRNQQPQPQVMEQVPIAEAAPEPITMAGVQAMIHTMMAEQREEIRKILLNNRSEPSMPVEQPELNDGQLEEGNYSRSGGQTEPLVDRRNNQEEGVEKNGCKYKDFMTCKPSTFTRKEDPVGVMD